MREFLFLLILTGIYPLARAWLANRRTSLCHALTWAGIAWLGWLAVCSYQAAEDSATTRYAALCLACCPGIAVLGARRPNVTAWDLVVLGLLTVMLWPLLEGVIIGRETLGTLNLVFLAGVLTVSIVNYLPTRMGPAVVLAGIACAAEWLLVMSTFGAVADEAVQWLAGACFAAAPWLAYWFWGKRRPANTMDRLWLDFRDRYGLAWGQRVREQFNRAAANAGWPVFLSWRGLRVLPGSPVIDETAEREMLETMTGLLQRFMAPGLAATR